MTTSGYMHTHCILITVFDRKTDMYAPSCHNHEVKVKLVPGRRCMHILFFQCAFSIMAAALRCRWWWGSIYMHLARPTLLLLLPCSYYFSLSDVSPTCLKNSCHPCDFLIVLQYNNFSASITPFIFLLVLITCIISKKHALSRMITPLLIFI
jgi:hypothetical protein